MSKNPVRVPPFLMAALLTLVFSLAPAIALRRTRRARQARKTRLAGWMASAASRRPGCAILKNTGSQH